ncbi:MAG: intradiol ring-cleavage dioxygenase [Cytophagales bacterium]|nr:intradiol ring-cleavage dioxygenase [Cytophagales bacterium]
MDRKKFIKEGLMGVGAMVTIPSVITSCIEDEPVIEAAACQVSPAETAGPFPIKSPADLIRENIVGDRSGIPLQIMIKVENTNDNCEPLAGVLVDVWHCDAKGNYSEYSGQLEGDFTNQSFLRGRQTTGADGVASFISIYPGWYPGRAPHLHLEIKRTNGESLLITQTAFPEDVSNTVYESNGYNGNFDTSNEEDGAFGASLNRNMATSVVGNTTDGYVLTERIKVAG